MGKRDPVEALAMVLTYGVFTVVSILATIGVVAIAWLVLGGRKRGKAILED